MSKNQKTKKREKKYQPKDLIFKPIKPTSVEPTTKNILKKGLIQNFVLWLDGKYKAGKVEEDVFKGWAKMTYDIGSERDTNSKKFIDWYKKQRSKNLEVFAFDNQKFVEYKVKKAEEFPLPNNQKTIIVEIGANTKKEKTPATLTFTYFDQNSSQMIVYNSQKQAFNLEVEIVEKVKEKIKKEVVIQEINKDKTEKFKEKINKLLKSKVFEKAYHLGLENVKSEILNIIS